MADQPDQPESVRHFFEEFEQRVDASRSAGKHLSYRFDVRGVGSWRIELDDGAVRVSESGPDEAADCVVETDEKTFLGIVRRERSPIMAYMTGKVSVHGGVSKLAELQDILP
jgi:putative sterol carrier protein